MKLLPYVMLLYNVFILIGQPVALFRRQNQSTLLCLIHVSPKFVLQKNASLIMPWVNLARIALVLDAPKMLASFTYFATFPTILLLLFMCIRLIAHIEYYTIDFKSLVACGHLRRG